MPEPFDPYRDALVVEQKTVWPADASGWPLTPPAREAIVARLHEEPALAAQLDYIRLYTGFCRQITVTADDVERITGRRPA